MTRSETDDLDLLEDLIASARRAGADEADAIAVDGASVSVSVRHGRVEKLERSETADIGLRVFVGRRVASVSSSDRSPAALAELVERTLAMARAVPEDEFAGIAEPDQVAREWSDLDLFDPDEPGAEALIERARRAEAAALEVPGVSQPDSADAGWGDWRVSLAASNGFHGGYRSSSSSISTSVIAGEGAAMETDYAHASARHASDLETPEAIGRRAGERAVARLNPTQPATRPVPVIFDERVSRSLLSHLVGAISGPSIARGTSFLKDALNTRIFPDGIAIVDDALIPRGRRSKPFDAEGLATGRRTLVEDGTLTSWLLDLRSARQLGLSPTGHASRGTSGPPGPSPTNLYLEAGTLTRDELIAGVEDGFLVTSLMGMGVNGVTGDYSRGAAGFWIEKGRIARPVSQATIAGNLKSMFKSITAADDLVFRTGIDAPTVRIDGMTVAGR